MICIKTRYFNVNRILLLALGLWPYQRSKLVWIQIISLLIILISFVAFQFTVFLTAECTPRFIIKVFSYIFPLITCIIKYSSFWINSQSMKHLLDQLQYIYNQIKDKEEICIIEKYGYKARNYTTKITLVFMCSIFILISLPMWQSIYCTFFITKEFQLRHPIQIQTEYFIDENKYSNIILIHMTAAICIAITAITGTGTMLISYLKYVCGVFRIASYRIEQAIMKTRKNNNSENNITIYKEMIYAVEIHRKAMAVSEFLIVNFEGSFFLLIIFGVAGLSCNLLRIFQVSFIEETLPHLVLASLILLYMFLANKIGQDISDYNNEVFLTVYNVQWYTTPLPIQRLILFLLQRSTKSFGLNVGGLYISSLECFAKLASASMSYVTVLYSMQK